MNENMREKLYAAWSKTGYDDEFFAIGEAMWNAAIAAADAVPEKSAPDGFISWFEGVINQNTLHFADYGTTQAQARVFLAMFKGELEPPSVMDDFVERVRQSVTNLNPKPPPRDKFPLPTQLIGSLQPDTAPMYKALMEARIALSAHASGAGIRAITLIDKVLNAVPTDHTSTQCVPDSRCKYTMFKDQPCKKCGRVHDGATP